MVLDLDSPVLEARLVIMDESSSSPATTAPLALTSSAPMTVDASARRSFVLQETNEYSET